MKKSKRRRKKVANPKKERIRRILQYQMETNGYFDNILHGDKYMVDVKDWFDEADPSDIFLKIRVIDYDDTVEPMLYKIRYWAYFDKPGNYTEMCSEDAYMFIKKGEAWLPAYVLFMYKWCKEEVEKLESRPMV